MSFLFFQILLSFLTFELERKNDCESNFIDVFGEITDIPSRYVFILTYLTKKLNIKYCDSLKLYILFYGMHAKIKLDADIYIYLYTSIIWYFSVYIYKGSENTNIYKTLLNAATLLHTRKADTPSHTIRA